MSELAEWPDETLAAVGRDPRDVDRSLNTDAAPVSALSSAEAFAETTAQASAPGFTDAIVRWPRATEAERRYEAVLEHVAGELRPRVGPTVTPAAPARSR